MKFSKEQINSLIKALYSGKVDVMNLPNSLYYAVVDYLKKGVYKGFGGGITSFEYDSIDDILIKELRENIYLFSSAKTFHFVLDTEGLLIENGKLIEYNEFKKRASDLYDMYYDNWLEAEYRTAIGQAQSARTELQIQKEKKIFPLVEYVAVLDETTAQVCRQMDGVIRKVDDPIWKTHSPLNHYQCRCLKRQLRDGEVTKLPTDLVDPVPAFQNNSGMTGEIFNKEHPYFDVPKKYKAYAKKNFNLVIPDND